MKSKLMKKLGMSILIGSLAVVSATPVMASTKVEEERNDTMATATYFRRSSRAKGYISSKNDVDWWRYKCIEDGVVTIEVDNVTSKYKYAFEVYDENNNMVASTYYGMGNKQPLKVNFERSTTYYFKIYSIKGYDPEQPYRITVEEE